MKRKIYLVASLAIFLVIVYQLFHAQVSLMTQVGGKKIGITQIVDYPALNEVRAGIISGLAKSGYVEGKNLEIIYQNSKGDASLIPQIIKNFIAQKVDVIVPITTPSTLSAVASKTNIPIVFGGVTDPVSTKIVRSLEHTGGNITGTSDQWPFERQVAIYLELFPATKSIGMLYKPGDDVSKIAQDKVEKLAKDKNIIFKKYSVSQTSDIYAVAKRAFREVDFIYLGIDAFVLNASPQVLKASRESGKNLVAGDDSLVKDGVILAFSINMFDLGVKTGEYVARVLNGEKPSEIPVYVVSFAKPVINKKLAEKFNLNLSEIKDVTLVE